ncbi:unnamed protein product [Boreogadus saida]
MRKRKEQHKTTGIIALSLDVIFVAVLFDLLCPVRAHHHTTPPPPYSAHLVLLDPLTPSLMPTPPDHLPQKKLFEPAHKHTFTYCLLSFSLNSLSPPLNSLCLFSYLSLTSLSIFFSLLTLSRSVSLFLSRSVSLSVSLSLSLNYLSIFLHPSQLSLPLSFNH